MTALREKVKVVKDIMIGTSGDSFLREAPPFAS
jgi:hypothetical protein